MSSGSRLACAFNFFFGRPPSFKKWTNASHQRTIGARSVDPFGLIISGRQLSKCQLHHGMVLKGLLLYTI